MLSWQDARAGHFVMRDRKDCPSVSWNVRAGIALRNIAVHFTRGALLNGVTASRIEQPPDAIVFAGKVKIGRAYADPFRCGLPVKKQRPAKTAPLIGILDGNTDFGVLRRACKDVQNTENAAVGLDPADNFRAGPIGDHPHRPVWQDRHETKLAQGVPQAQVMRPQGVAPIGKGG